MPAVGQAFNPYRTFVGAFIPNALMSYTGLSAGPKLLWARLAQYAGKEGRAYPKQETLALDLGTSERNVRMMLDALAKEGFLSVEAPDGKDRLAHRPNTYRFLWHEIFEQASSLPERKDPSGPERQDSSGRNEEENQVEENQKKPPPVVSSPVDSGDGEVNISTSEETEGGGGSEDLGNSGQETADEGTKSILEETALRADLVMTGMGNGVAMSIIRKVPASEIRRKLRAYRDAGEAGRKLGPGLLANALLSGGEIDIPEPEVVAPVGGPESRYFEVRCPGCGATGVRAGRSREDVIILAPTCRKCHEMLEVLLEVPASEVETVAVD